MKQREREKSKQSGGCSTQVISRGAQHGVSCPPRVPVEFIPAQLLASSSVTVPRAQYPCHPFAQEHLNPTMNKPSLIHSWAEMGSRGWKHGFFQMEISLLLMVKHCCAFFFFFFSPLFDFIHDLKWLWAVTNRFFTVFWTDGCSKNTSSLAVSNSLDLPKQHLGLFVRRKEIKNCSHSPSFFPGLLNTVDNAGTNYAQGKPEVQPQRSRNGFWNHWLCTDNPKVTSDPSLQQQKSEEMWWELPHIISSSSCPKELLWWAVQNPKKNHKISQSSNSGFIQQGSSYNFPVINSWSSLGAFSSRGLAQLWGPLPTEPSEGRQLILFCFWNFFRDIILFLRSFKYHLCLVLQKPH